MKNKFKLAVCQMKVMDNKSLNISRAWEMINSAAKKGADLVLLPEMFNCPYENSKFPQYAEAENDGATIRAISAIAAELGIYIVAGSIPEMHDGKIYNSSFVFGRNGEIVGKHRKMHLFDINAKDRISFRESDTLSAGNDITVIDTEFCKIGVAICYDMRFPELMRLMALKGAKLILVPAAFNTVTGPAHWEALIRIRAVDNQVYLAAASPARNMEASYKAYGHSMVVEPWGEIVAHTKEKEEIIYADIDLTVVDRVRDELPLLAHRRTDIYEIGHK